MTARSSRASDQNFESWRGGIELSLVRWMEQVHKTSYWVARDVAMDVVKKAKGLRKLYKEGISSSQAAARIAAELPQEEDEREDEAATSGMITAYRVYAGDGAGYGRKGGAPFTDKADAEAFARQLAHTPGFEKSTIRVRKVQS